MHLYLFRRWLSDNGSNASYCVLKDALEKGGRRDLADEVDAFLKETENDVNGEDSIKQEEIHSNEENQHNE